MLDRLQLIPALRARWRFALLIWVLIVGAVVALTHYYLPPRYEATATLVIEMSGADPIRGGELYRPAGSISSFLSTQADVIRSEVVARGAMEILGLHKRESVRELWQRQTEGRGDYEAWIANRLLRELAVTPSRDSNAVSVSYTSQNPKFSAEVTNAFVKAYMDTALRMRAGPAAQFNTFFEQRAQSLRRTLDEAKARLSEYEEKHGLIVGDLREPDAETTRLSQLTAQLVTLQDEATAAANRQRQAMRRAEMSEVRQDPEVVELNAQLAREQVALSKLRTEFGERHPAVIQAQKSIEDLRARVSASTQRAATTFSVPVKANDARLTEVRAAIERQRALVLKRQSQRNAAAPLLRDVESAQRAYDAVLQRASQTALEAANTTQPNISVVRTATPPAFASSIYMMITLFVAALLAPLLAAAGAVLRESRDRRLRTTQDVTALLRQPLLLTLPDAHARGRATARRSLETQRRLVSVHPRLPAPQ